MFLDESAFYLLPFVAKTYAPAGQTPLLKEYLSRDHLSMIGAVTADGRLYLHQHEHPIRQQEVISFLKRIEREIATPLLVVWDGAPIHRGKQIRSHLASVGPERLWLEALPGYAPELNPAEGIWQHLKCVDLPNLCCQTLTELKHQLHNAKERLRRKPNLIAAYFDRVGFL